MMTEIQRRWAHLKKGDLTQFRAATGTIHSCRITARNGRELSIAYTTAEGELVKGESISIYDLVTDEEVATARSEGES